MCVAECIGVSGCMCAAECIEMNRCVGMGGRVCVCVVECVGVSGVGMGVSVYEGGGGVRSGIFVEYIMCRI